MSTLTKLLVGLIALSAGAETKAPFIVFVHGGAWVSGRADQYRDLESALKTRGFCVRLLDYKLAPTTKHPEPVTELNSEILKVAKDAAIACDPNRIYLVGHSAGAHMIAFWNTVYTNPRVKGLIGLEGIYDLPLLIQTWPAYEGQFIEAEFGAERASASPARLTVKNRARWLLMQSTEDELVDGAQTRVFADHLRQAKIAVKTIDLKGTHFAAVESLKNAGSLASRELQKFIEP